MEALYKAFEEKHLPIPMGLIALIEKGNDRRTIYKRMWAAAKFGGGLGGENPTFVFPKEVREAVRERFHEEMCGVYDDQYKNKEGVYYVSLEEMASLPYPKHK